MDSVDREIINASKVIDRALAKMNEENRGEEALNMLSVTILRARRSYRTALPT